MVTKAILRDRIRKILSGGYPSDRDRVKDNEIILSIGDIMGELLKISAIDGMSVDGDTVIDGACVATYENITVEPDVNNTSKVKLPAYPMKLPDNMGVFSVYPSGQPQNEYIPIPTGIFYIWTKDRLVSPISMSLYYWDSRYIHIQSDLIGSGISTVDVKLCIMDIDTYDDNDVLPLSADQGAELIKRVCAQYGMESSTMRKESAVPSPEIVGK